MLRRRHLQQEQFQEPMLWQSWNQARDSVTKAVYVSQSSGNRRIGTTNLDDRIAENRRGDIANPHTKEHAHEHIGK